MLGFVAEFLKKGDRDRAREALAAAVKDLFYSRFIKGDPDSPLLSCDGTLFFQELRPLAPALLEDSARGTYVRRAIDEILGRMARKEGYDSVVFLANHVLLLVHPAAAEAIAQALQDARYELARRAELDEQQEHVFKPLALEVISAGLNNARLGKIQRLRLADLDGSGKEFAGKTALEGIEGGDLVFTCPSCGAKGRAALVRAGDDLACGCGEVMRVPIPTLSLAAEARKVARDAAIGIVPCRICGARVQTRKDAVARAGFCSPLCAKQGRERFGEYVARSGTLEGSDVAFACECGAPLRAEASQVGTCVCCDGCGLQVWVPEAAGGTRAGGDVLDCPKCGRKVRSTARRCMFCDRPIS